MSTALIDPAAWRDAGAYHAWYAEAARRSAEIQRINERRTGLSFGRWLKQASPGWPWSAPHLVAVRRALARIERGETDRLMIFLHPRSYKSQMVTVRWPAYLLERDPLTRIIVGSYNQTLAESFSHETRRIVTERGIALDPKRQSVDNWLTAAGGGLRAVGVGGGVTGHGANCFTGETEVLTEIGPIPIEQLARMARPPMVVSLDTTTLTAHPCPVVASRDTRTNELIEIETDSGKRIRCTPDHRIFTESGYRKASLLREGERLFTLNDLSGLSGAKMERGEILSGLLSEGTGAKGSSFLCRVWRRIRDVGLRIREKGQAREFGRLLLAPMLRGLHQPNERREKSVPVVPAYRRQKKGDAVLFGRVPKRGSSGKKANDSTEAKADTMSELRYGVPENYQPAAVLLKSLRESGSFPKDARRGEFPLQERDELCQVVRLHATVDSGKGREQVPALRGDGGNPAVHVPRQDHSSVESAYSPHRRGSPEQFGRESDNSMPFLSHHSPQVGRWDRIVRIHRLRVAGEPVYDIQVEGLHNFFAGGVLAHNCLLIDDPVKNYEEANSRAYQERVWHWWQYDLQTRLEPHPRTGRPPAVVLTMTRWSENDLAGRILASEGGERWEVLRIPALAETQEERDDYAAGIGRPTGEPDPLGRQPGEAMDPARFPVTVLEEKRAEGLMAFMALYQNRPTAPAGDMFRREWFETVSELPAGNRTLVRYWDKAGTAGAGAYTAGVLMARIDEDRIASYYVVHAVMGRWNAAEREHVIRQTAAADFAAYGYDVETVVEQEPGSGGKESAESTVRELSSMGYRVAADRPTGDKVLRAEPLAAAAGVGRVKLVAGAWNRDYLDILAAFPGGAIKDTVDASSGGYIRLSRAEDKRPKSSAPAVVTAEDMFG